MKFKAGDKVVRVRGDFGGIKRGDVGTVVEVRGTYGIRLYDHGGTWFDCAAFDHASDKFQAGDPVIRTSGYYNDMQVGDVDVVVARRNNIGLEKFGTGHSEETLRVVGTAEGSEELPPTPKDGLYFNHIGTRDLTIRLHKGRYDAIAVKTPSGQCSLSADTALQLAHDLRRMAMDIKRKAKLDG